MINRYINKLQYYPIVQIICIFPATVNRIMYYYFDHNYVFWMSLIQIIFDSLTGLIFSIVFGFNPNVIMIICEFKEKICSKKKKKNPFDREDSSSDSSSINQPIRYTLTL
jgi:hypothetical protein